MLFLLICHQRRAYALFQFTPNVRRERWFHLCPWQSLCCNFKKDYAERIYISTKSVYGSVTGLTQDFRCHPLGMIRNKRQTNEIEWVHIAISTMAVQWQPIQKTVKHVQLTTKHYHDFRSFQYFRLESSLSFLSSLFSSQRTRFCFSSLLTLVPPTFLCSPLALHLCSKSFEVLCYPLLQTMLSSQLCSFCLWQM